MSAGYAKEVVASTMKNLVDEMFGSKKQKAARAISVHRVDRTTSKSTKACTIACR